MKYRLVEVYDPGPGKSTWWIQQKGILWGWNQHSGTYMSCDKKGIMERWKRLKEEGTKPIQQVLDTCEV